MPVKTYERKPKTIEVLIWDGTNKDEVVAFGGNYIEWHNGHLHVVLDKPNCYGYTSLPVNEGGALIKYNGAKVTTHVLNLIDYNEIQ